MTKPIDSYLDPYGFTLRVQSFSRPDARLILEIEPNPVAIVEVPVSVAIPAAELLGMIDAADPDAMRAYLRETAPEVIADLYRPAPAAGEHFDYLEPGKVTPERLDAGPEADSPEDVDERPARDDPTERAQIDRSWALDRAADALGRLSAVGSPAGALPLLDVAGWIIDGTINLPEQILDTNMAGEVIS